MPRGGHNRLPDAVARARRTDRRGPKREVPDPEPGKVPSPPPRLSAAERRIWLELAEQVEALGVFTASDRTGFRLMVRAVAAVDGVGPKAPPSALAALQRNAAAWLARFGLTPADRGRVPAPKRAGGVRAQVEASLFGTPLVGPGLRVVEGGSGASTKGGA